MHRIFRVKAYEKEHGPHFNEEYARKAVQSALNQINAGVSQISAAQLSVLLTL